MHVTAMATGDKEMHVKAKDGSTRLIQLRECMVIPGARGCAVVSIGRLMQDKQARVFTQTRDGATMELFDGATVILSKEHGLVVVTTEGRKVDVQPKVSNPKNAEVTTTDGRADRGAPRGQMLEKEVVQVQATIEEQESVQQTKADDGMKSRAAKEQEATATKQEQMQVKVDGTVKPVIPRSAVDAAKGVSIGLGASRGHEPRKEVDVKGNHVQIDVAPGGTYSKVKTNPTWADVVAGYHLHSTWGM
jgi:hypothetical protein